MCLAVPMKLVGVNGPEGEVEVDGVRRTIGLALLPDAKLGDDVLVHAGYAISVVDPQEAEETRQLLAQIFAAGDAEEAS